MDVAVAYHITRGVFMTAYGVLVVLFSVQCLLQFARDRRSFLSFKTVHSTFTLSGLSISSLLFIAWFDGSSVFGIYPLVFTELTWVIAVSVWVTCYLFSVYIAIRALYSMSSEECDKYKRRARRFITGLVGANLFNVVAHGIWFVATLRWTPNVISWSVTELIITTSVAFETRTFIQVSRRLKGSDSPKLKRWRAFTIISTSVIPLICLIHIYLNFSYLFGPDRLSKATDDFYSPQEWQEQTRVLLNSAVWIGTATMLVLAWKPLKAEDVGRNRKSGTNTGTSAGSHWFQSTKGGSQTTQSRESRLSVPSKQPQDLDVPTSAEAHRVTASGASRMRAPKRQSDFGFLSSVEPPQHSGDGVCNITEAHLMTPSRERQMSMLKRQSEVRLLTSVEAHLTTHSRESRMIVPNRQSGYELSKQIEAHLIMMAASRKSRRNQHPKIVPIAQACLPVELRIT